MGGAWDLPFIGRWIPHVWGPPACERMISCTHEIPHTRAWLILYNFISIIFHSSKNRYLNYLSCFQTVITWFICSLTKAVGMLHLFIESDLRFFSTIFTTYVTGQGQLHTIGSCESCDQTKVLITNERRLWQKLCTYIFYQKNLPWIVFVTSDMKSRSISHLPDNNSNKKDDCKNLKKKI